MLGCNATSLHKELSNAPLKLGVTLAAGASARCPQSPLHKLLLGEGALAAVISLSPYISKQLSQPTSPGWGT
jgi:hypothetical protein